MSASFVPSEPLVTFDQLCETNFIDATASFLDLTKEFVSKEENTHHIPHLSANKSLDRIPDGHFIRFRGMIQDMLETELYVSEFIKIHKLTKASTKSSAKFREAASLDVIL
ncbi:hypothetical protein Ciccas_000257 [Cichlidogyrus casuarinus]|uniref:Mini-chromosome maintenance complex-binding protein n=1 Tax=Cichlidogyrus casuarinus TaxID=1844966 RepID=A0ABD2QNE5_9PLAT